MGTEAGRGYQTGVGESMVEACAAAVERKDEAVLLCSGIRALALADIEEAKLQACWTLLIKCAARALDYDARVVPPSVLPDVAVALDQSLRETADVLCGRRLSEEAWQQLQLPGPLGGCGLRLPSTVLHAGYWASWASQQDLCDQLQNALHRVGDFSVQDQLADLAATELHRHGIQVARGIAPSLTEEATAKFQEVPWERSDEGPKDGKTRYMGWTLRLIEWQMAARLWCNASQHTRSVDRPP